MIVTHMFRHRIQSSLWLDCFMPYYFVLTSYTTFTGYYIVDYVFDTIECCSVFKNVLLFLVGPVHSFFWGVQEWPKYGSFNFTIYRDREQFQWGVLNTTAVGGVVKWRGAMKL